MKHKMIDLASEVRRANLPDGLPGFLFPVFEAISNALHSVEERWEEESEEKGSVVVSVSLIDKSISISDNGVGLNQDNLVAFLTPLTGNKFARGGKGFGRFIAFKNFGKVFYSSRQKENGGQITSGSYRYEPFSIDDNLIEVEPSEGAGAHRFDTGLTTLMQSPSADASAYLDPAEVIYADAPAANSIASAIVDHFLVEFIQRKIPKVFQLEVDGIAINLHAYFNDSLLLAGSYVEIIKVDGYEQSFEFNFFKVGVDQAQKHRLYFYSDNRAASDLENISSGLNDKPFIRTGSIGPAEYCYLVSVSSPFFVSSQSRDRITNLGYRVMVDGRKKPLRELLIATAKQQILALESGYTAARRAVMESEVEHLISIDPLLRRGLGDASVAEFVRRRSITETREQLAQDLFVERFRRKFDFSKLSPDASIEELVDIVKTKIPEDAKEALAVYVSYRNHVIKIFQGMLDRTKDGLATEDRVHQLIYPRYKDSEEVDYSAHNLWLLDDDLAYAQYISSDRTPDGRQRVKGDYAHDILVNNSGELMIVEMKRPQKTGYTIDPEAGTNNPVDQLKNQVADIRKKGRIRSSSGREIIIPSDKMVRGYILADWNESLNSYLETEDFVITNYGGQMAYRYFATRNLMVEVIAFDRLADRASNRNDAFVRMLEGHSTYARKSTSPF